MHGAIHKIEDLLGFQPWVLRGVLGIDPRSTTSHGLWVLLGFVMFFVSQLMFIAPGRGWWKRNVDSQRLNIGQISGVSLVAAMLSAAAIVAILDVPGIWLDLSAKQSNWFGAYGLTVSEQTFWILVMLAPLWVGWGVFFARFRRNSDAYVRLLSISYFMFVAAGIEAILTGLYLVKVVGFDPPFFYTGSYTAMIISLAAVLWTAGPGLTLLFTSQRYFWRRYGQCERCGYDLRATIDTGGDACSECGHIIAPAILSLFARIKTHKDSS